MFKRILAVPAAICLCAAMLVVGVSARGSTVTSGDGQYRILVLPDLRHNDKEDDNLYAYVDAAIKYRNTSDTNPLDLVVLLGDSLGNLGEAPTEAQVRFAVHDLLRPIYANETPFVVVLGAETAGMSKAALEQIFIEDAGDASALCLNNPAAETWYSDLSGGVNFMLPVKTTAMEQAKDASGALLWETETGTELDDLGLPLKVNSKKPKLVEVRKSFANLFFFDVGRKDEGQAGRPYVRADQVQWFNTINDKTVPAFVFQGIAMPQIYDYFVSYKTKLPGTKEVLGRYVTNIPSVYKMRGHVLETPSPALFSDGEFEALEAAGNVRGVFFGGDPRNEFIVAYNDKPFYLAQLPGAGWLGCRGSFMTRGGTNVTLRYNTKNELTSGTDLFTYRQAARVKGSAVQSTINGLPDFWGVVKYGWQEFCIAVTYPIRALQGRD